MTDHLEPYRRMVRSIRFVPPLGRNQSVSEPVKPAPIVNSSFKTNVPEATATPAPGPAPDPSEHVAALIRSAVSKPTVLPVVYVIPENIGDRISRLAPPKAVTSVTIAPKIPQPDPNWKPANRVEPKDIESEWQKPVEDSYIAAYTPVEVAEEPPQLAPEAPASVVESPSVEETSQLVPEAEAPTSVVESPVEEPSQLVPIDIENAKSDLKKSPTPLEMAPIGDRQTSETEEDTQIKCPSCESMELRKNGHRKDKQRYICKDCGRQFVVSNSLDENQKQLTTTTNSRAKTPEVKEAQAHTSVSDSTSKSPLSQSQNKKKPKGFGTKKAK